MTAAPRPSLVEIAAAAGVSTMAVSFALRGKSHVSAATRERILREADRLGYRPDPLVAQLMNHVRTRRVRHIQANLGLLLFHDDDYLSQLTAGVVSRAETLGYAVDKMAVQQFVGNPVGLTRVLRARGIEGLLLSPCRTPQSLLGLLDWTQFSAVAMSYSISEPALDRVVPHHFHNGILALRRMRERGYRWPAFVLNCDHDVRANHAYSAAAAWSAIQAGETAIPGLMSPDVRLRGVREWAERNRPDAIIVGSMKQIECDLRPALDPEMLKRIGLAILEARPGLTIHGIDQQTPLVGAAAVDMLVAQIHRRARGVPSHAVVAMVEGNWTGDLPGAALPLKKRAAGAGALRAAAK